MKTIYTCSPALWLIFAAPFWVILLGKVPANNKLALLIIADMDSDYNNKYLRISAFTLPLTTSCQSRASLLPLPLQLSAALHQMWACRPGAIVDEEREQAGASTRQLGASHRQVRFCPVIITRPHKHFKYSHTQPC